MGVKTGGAWTYFNQFMTKSQVYSIWRGTRAGVSLSLPNSVRNSCKSGKGTVCTCEHPAADPRCSSSFHHHPRYSFHGFQCPRPSILLAGEHGLPLEQRCLHSLLWHLSALQTRTQSKSVESKIITKVYKVRIKQTTVTSCLKNSFNATWHWYISETHYSKISQRCSGVLKWRGHNIFFFTPSFWHSNSFTFDMSPNSASVEENDTNCPQVFPPLLAN